MNPIIRDDGREKGKLQTLDIEWEIDDIDTVLCHTLIYQVEIVIFRFVENCGEVKFPKHTNESSVLINHEIIGGNVRPKLQTVKNVKYKLKFFVFRESVWGMLCS